MSSHRITSLHLDDLEYAKGRIAQYNELPTKAQLLQFIFEVEERIRMLEFATRERCEDCGAIYEEEE
jgi:hypothetical protein